MSHRGWAGRSSLLHNGTRAPHSLRVKLKSHEGHMMYSVDHMTSRVQVRSHDQNY